MAWLALCSCLMATVMEAESCLYTKWADPPLPEPTQEYIHYLKCKIFDLKRRVEDLQAEVDANPSAVNIAGDPICIDPWCKCPYHPYHHNKDRPPSLPSSGGAGYYETRLFSSLEASSTRK
ncbi:hypothetical protein SETIT_7G297100v2 [Setaria italica]|uniref:Uncharacterized protein n=1 Tax=Setaria italica TaxID=4555 RepID=A0A368S168_SETIT|nr:hypothetical protein SETIT_7G297100v2 [Setaria italica]